MGLIPVEVYFVPLSIPLLHLVLCIGVVPCEISLGISFLGIILAQVLIGRHIVK